jgi:hypothetical protein
MEIIGALNRMEEIEKKASELYRGYHAAFFHDEEAAYFFYKLYLEEKGHRNLVQYVKRLVRQNPKMFSGVDFTEEEFDKILSRLNEELSRKHQPSLMEAIEIAEEFEITLSEGYLKHLPLKHNSILLDLYNALGEKDHSEKITAFKMKIGAKG